MREIEQGLTRGSNTPTTRYNKNRAEKHRLKIREILGGLGLQISPLDGSFSVFEGALDVTSAVSDGTALVESGTSLALRSILCGMLIGHFLACNVPAFEHLIGGAFTRCELSPLIEKIFSREDVLRKMVGSLRRDNVQSLIDVIDEVRATFFPHCEVQLIEPRSRLGAGQL